MSKMVNQLPQNNPEIAALITKSTFNSENKNPRSVAERLPRIYSSALRHKRNKDLKQAFIFLKRYLNVIEWIKKTKEYRDNSLDYKQYMPDNQIKEIKLAFEEVQAILLNAVFPTSNDNKGDTIVNANRSLSLNKNPSNDKTLDITLNFPDTPTDEPISNEPDTFMTCIQLFQLLETSPILIIDTRSNSEFDNSRIKTKSCVNIPASEIRDGIIVTSFEKYLKKSRNKEEALLFSRRSKNFVNSLIIMDWMTNRKTIDKARHLITMKRLLLLWDPGHAPPNIFFLDGGYSEWLNVYPTLVTNPHVIVPNPENDVFDEILEDIQYPDYLTEKEISEALKNYPEINRTIKNAHSNLMNRSFNTNKMSINLDESKQPFSYVDEESMDLTHLSNEVQNIDLSTKKVTLSIPSVSKPPIDRSSKPALLSKSVQPQALTLLSNLNEVVDNQEKIERQLADFVDKIYSKFNNEQHDSEDLDTLKKQEKAVELTLQEILAEKARLKSEWEVMKIADITKQSMEYNRLELRLGDVEQRIAGISMEKKMQQKKFELQQNMLTTPKHNNNHTYKEPLKSEGATTNSGFKRSLSSPNLAQVKKSKTENQFDDRKTPQIDRSSKPVNIRRTIRESNNNSQNTWRDPIKQMDPVYRHGHPGITGLKNLGNSCYMNSIIQCLSNTAYLVRYFTDNSYQDDLNTNSDNETRGQIAEEFAHVMKALWRGQYKSIAPRDLKNAIGQYKSQFDSYEQQDSHEFLTFLLDWMHNDLRKADIKLQRDGPLSTAEKEWEKSMKGETSIISKLFYGQLRSSICCLTCSSRSITYETFNSLSISLIDSYRCTLENCIQHFLSGQKISGWACPNCKIPRDAMKKFDFVKLAPILVIHLNRFAGTDVGLEKKNTPVIFPLNDLNMRSYLVFDSDSSNTVHNNSRHYSYNLYAISNHYGSMGGGHYTALCKSSALNKWYRYDDHTVTEVTESHVKTQNSNAYLLFYSSLQCEPSTYI